MAESSVKTPVKVENKTSEPAPRAWHPLESLRQEVDRLFDDFQPGAWRWPFRRAPFAAEPLWRREFTLSQIPAVDVTESETAYELKADMPGMDEKDIEVKVANGNLTIRGEKHEEKEEKKKDYYLRERSSGSFERSFPLPDSVNRDAIEASFKKGVLTVTLPKTPEARKAEKKITVKGA
jgi:HSP20 family protein